jgi:outer membrane protein TolC
MKKYFLIVFGLLGRVTSYCQQDFLEAYVRQGLQSNLALKEQAMSIEKASYALQEAKALFYPAVTFQSDYTYADGGRKIPLPLGDLFNPVYSTLNHLTNTTKFPVINNQQILLNTNDYHDTRLVTNIPLFNAELRYNYRLKKENIEQQRQEIQLYKRSLVKEIKIAYYTILSTLQQIAVLENASQLLDQNFRLTQSLAANGKALKGNTDRILSDISFNNARLAEARDNRITAIAYLNFLLNRGLNEPIQIDSTLIDRAAGSAGSADSVGSAGSLVSEPTVPHANSSDKREEIAILKSAARQADDAIRLRKSAALPSLSTFLNAGFQGYYFKFNKDQQYLFGGLSLKWTLFGGLQNRYKIKDARLDRMLLDIQMDETRKQIDFQAIQAGNKLHTVRETLLSTTASVDYAREYYRETANRYAQGLILQVVLTDAFTQLINSQLANKQAALNWIVQSAELEQVLASYPL